MSLQDRRPEAFGLDLNKWNGRNAVDKLHEDVSFVLHKATEGATVQDPTYHENKQTIQMLTPHDVLWFAFHVIVDISSLIGQVNNFNNYARLEKGEGAAVDLEHSEAEDIVHELGSSERAVQFVRDFGLRIAGKYEDVRPILYSSKRALEDLVGVDFDNHRSLWPIPQLEPLAEVYDLWVVQYVATTQANMDWRKVEEVDPVRVGWWPGNVVLRQYSSSADGRPYGVQDRDVDVNICYDVDRLRRCVYSSHVEPQHEPAPDTWTMSAIKAAVSQVLQEDRQIEGFGLPNHEFLARVERQLKEQ